VLFVEGVRFVGLGGVVVLRHRLLPRFGSLKEMRKRRVGMYIRKSTLTVFNQMPSIRGSLFMTHECNSARAVRFSPENLLTSLLD